MNSPRSKSVTDDGRKALSDAVTSGLRTLLEEKHLYQYVDIPITEIVGECAKEARRRVTHNEEMVEEATRTTLFLAGRVIPWVCLLETPAPPIGAIELPSALEFSLPSVRMFCTECDDREPYNPTNAASANLPGGDQVFLFGYHCQGCLRSDRKAPEFLMVRRLASTDRLTLSGRSPIASAPLPAFIPRKPGAFYRKAMIAAATGFTLAGFAYLRTFIEAFARSETKIENRVFGETLMHAYTSTLPPRVRDTAPSLASIYDELSDAMHRGDEDRERYERLCGQVEEHFEIRHAMRRWFTE